MNSEKMTAKDIADDVQQTVEDCSNSYRSTIQKRIEELVQSELEELWKELATAKREIERLEQFEETYTRQAELLTASIAREDELEHQLASVKSELENLQEDHKILHNNYHVQAEDEIELKANNKILGDNVTCLRKQLLEITDELKDAEVEANQYRALYETTLSDNKRLSDVVEGIEKELQFSSSGDAHKVLQLIASLETK